MVSCWCLSTIDNSEKNNATWDLVGHRIRQTCKYYPGSDNNFPLLWKSFWIKSFLEHSKCFKQQSNRCPKYRKTNNFSLLFKNLLIHEADPRSRPVVITFFAGVVRPSVPTIQNLAKRSSSENSDHYWRECGSGRVDHWWQAFHVLAYVNGRNLKRAWK